MAATMAAATESEGTPAPDGRWSLALGTAVGAVAMLMVFAGLAAAYLAFRQVVRPWPPEEVEFDFYLSRTLLITVAMASVMFEWAAYALRKEVRGQAMVAFFFTLVLVVAHVVGLSYLMAQLPFSVGDGAYATIFWAMASLAWLAGLSGLGAVVLAGLRAVGGQLGPGFYAPVRAAALWWHAVAVAWIAVYYVLYTTK